MNNFMNLPAEILGFFILVLAIAIRISVPAIADFWLALVTGIALFLAMHVRAYLSLKRSAKDKPLP